MHKFRQRGALTSAQPEQSVRGCVQRGKWNVEVVVWLLVFSWCYADRTWIRFQDSAQGQPAALTCGLVVFQVELCGLVHAPWLRLMVGSSARHDSQSSASVRPYQWRGIGLWLFRVDVYLLSLFICVGAAPLGAVTSSGYSNLR